jgi:hypothetical protein
MDARERLAIIKKDIENSKTRLKELHDAREALKPIPPQQGIHPMLRAMAIEPSTFNLLAQGDSWFDYLPGHDLIKYLRNKHGHKIENVAVGGSTLNDIVYGPVPKNWLGISQADDIDRMTELVARIQATKPQGLLLSGGGNDIAGEVYFSFLNNAKSNLNNPNDEVLKGVISETFEKAYDDLIQTAILAAEGITPAMKIFTHGYDYPWPDGRGLTMFNLVGPWFDDSFNKKNYPYDGSSGGQLKVRYDIVKVFIDSMNRMLKGLEVKYPGQVFHVDLRGTLNSRDEWANELHPKNPGFEKLADKFNLVLHQHLP